MSTLYKIEAEKPIRVEQSVWRNKQCANAYCNILQNRWTNEKFIVRRLRVLSSRLTHPNLK